MSKIPYHEAVAQKIIEQLKQGTAPWLKPWKPGEPSTLVPVNPVTGKRYRGINAIHLMGHEYPDNRWMTYKQALTLDAQVRKGEKGTTIQYWKFSEDTKTEDSEGNPITLATRLERPKVFYATVFNAAQIDNLSSLPQPDLKWVRLDEAEEILKNSGAILHHNEFDRAFYRPSSDSIHLPPKHQFEEAALYYATALHELSHWTGHESRLNRDLSHPFGSEGYAREELRAEIASMLLGDELGTGHDPSQHTSYIKTWIRVLENDPLEIFRAAADAEKIQSHLLAFTQTLEQTPVIMDEQPAEIALMQQTSSEKTRLVIPYEQKELAKSIVGKLEDGKSAIVWDRTEKCWYAREGAPLDRLSAWLPDNQAVQPKPVTDIASEFRAALSNLGCIVSDNHPIMDGNTHRIAVEGDKKSEKSGFYVLHTDGLPAGYIKNNRTGVETRWKSKGYTLNAEQKQKLTTEAAEKLKQRTQQISELQQATALKLQSKLANLIPVQSKTPYLENKQVLVFSGIYTDNEGKMTCVPATDKDGKLWSVQYISEDGTKRFAKNSRKEGCFHVVGGFDALAQAPTIIIAEGYATAATLSESTGFATISAFDSGNLKSVAEVLRSKFPQKAILIAGDDDHCLERAKGVNPGRSKAIEAAEIVNGKYIFPEFTQQERSDMGCTDFNDMAVKCRNGMQRVSFQLAGAILKTEKTITIVKEKVDRHFVKI